MPATPLRPFRLTDEEIARLDDLGRLWGPVKALNRTDVIRELIRRAHAEIPTAPARKLPLKPKRP